MFVSVHFLLLLTLFPRNTTVYLSSASPCKTAPRLAFREVWRQEKNRFHQVEDLALTGSEVYNSLELDHFLHAMFAMLSETMSCAHSYTTRSYPDIRAIGGQAATQSVQGLDEHVGIKTVSKISRPFLSVLISISIHVDEFNAIKVYIGSIQQQSALI